MTKERNQKLLWVLSLVAVLVVAALPADAEQLEAAKPVVRMSMHGGSASFAPLVAADGMTLTVGGQGHELKQRVGSGQTASFAPVDAEGYMLPDGTYTWEITVTPRLDRGAVRELEPGRVSVNGRSMEAAALPRGERQSGSFTIKNGRMVDPTLVEPESARPEMAPVEASAPPSAAERAAEHTDMDH